MRSLSLPKRSSACHLESILEFTHMSGFSADWLRLREPFDHQARLATFNALGLSTQVKQWRAKSGSPALTVLDLACGSGSNVRALAPQLGGAQRWRLLDHDPALLSAVPKALADWAQRHGYPHEIREQGPHGPGCIQVIGSDFSVEVTLECLDLARDLPRLDLAQTQLVTGSALLDLVSATWLEALVQQAFKARAAMLFALNVDGHTTWTPPDPQDSAIHDLFGSHQSRDKGFGPALGAQAVSLALRLMGQAGDRVTQAPSDWVIDASHTPPDPAFDNPAMVAAMIDGMATAALEQAHGSNQTIAFWQARRLAVIPSTRLQVGHVDLFATLP
jgi:hypothetical protein